MKRALVAGAVLLLGAIGAGWWFAASPRDPAMAGAASPESSAGATLSWSSEADAGASSRAGAVIGVEGAPVAQAQVWLLDVRGVASFSSCSICEQAATSCSSPTTSAQLAHALHAGRRPTILAQASTDAQGAFEFPEAPTDAVIFAKSGDATGWLTEPAADPVIVLSVPEKHELRFVDDDDRPLAGLEVRSVRAFDGAVSTLVTNAQGTLVFPAADPMDWVLVERAGMAPVHARVDSDRTLQLGPPRVLIARTTLNGAPVDADIVFTGHGGEQHVRTTHGEARIEGLERTWTEFVASVDGFRSPPRSSELSRPEETLTFELRRQAVLSVSLTDEAGQPVESVSGTLASDQLTVSATAESGALLRFPPVPEGDYRLMLEGDGLSPMARQVELSGDQTLEIELLRLLTLEGVVRDADGAPAEYVSVSLVRSGVELASAMSSSDGTFTLQTPSGGALQVRAESQALGLATREVNVPGPKVELTLVAKNAFEGTIVDATGAPVEMDGVLERESGERLSLARVDEVKGRRANVPAGRYRFRYDGFGFRQTSVEVDVAAEGVTRARLVVDKGASVEGRVVDAQGHALVNANVFSMPRFNATTTDESGHFALEALDRGEVELVIDCDGFAEETVTVAAPERGLLVTLQKSPRATGRVVDSAHRPIREFQISDTWFRGPDGRFDVAVRSGSGLTISADGYRTLELEEVTAGDQGDLVLQAMQRLAGVVVDAAGQPVHGATVTLESWALSAVTGLDGRFQISSGFDLGADPLTLIARRGPRRGRAELRPGEEARITIGTGTHVQGRVLGPDGRGLRTVVSAQMLSDQEERATDAEGRFELELSPGVWTFTTRAGELKSAVAISGAEQRVELRVGGGCGLVLSADEELSFLALSPQPLGEDQDPFGEGIAGGLTVFFSVSEPERRVQGLPCGTWFIRAGAVGRSVDQQVTLREPAQPLRLSFPPTIRPE